MVKIRGDGFCFLSSVCEGLAKDHNSPIKVEEAIQLVIKQLVDHHRKYVAFHVVSKLLDEEPVSPSDMLINEAMDFFEKRNFTLDVVDLLIKVTTDALGVDLHIYQKHEGFIQCIKTTGGLACKPVHLKFTHNNVSSLGNHYDAIVKIQNEEDPAVSRIYDSIIIEDTDDVPTSTFDSTQIILDQHEEGFPENQDGQNIPQVGRGKYFPLYRFDSMIPEEIDVIPPDIDGWKFYKVPATLENWTTVTSDMRHFLMRTSSKKNYHGRRKVGICKGSLVCPNKHCGFISTSHNNQRNRINFVMPRGRDVKICQICEAVALVEPCGARKLIDFDPLAENALVYHIGHHKCSPKIDKRKDLIEHLSSQTQKFTGSAKDMAIKETIYWISKGDPEKARSVASTWTDLRTAKNLMNQQDEFKGEDHNSYDAVAIVKKAFDPMDEFLIYRINNGYMNNGADYVFKSSKVCAEIAIEMDIHAEAGSLFHLENAYFDCTHTRVYGFKTMGLWTYHPTMRKIVRLASMELRSENTESIRICLQLFNEILEKVTGKEGYKFNPRTFVCDENSANYKAVKEVYGIDFTRERVKGCQWHFKYDVKNKAKHVGPDLRDLFMEKCTELCHSTTVAAYYIVKSRLDEIGKAYPEIESWIDWWHERRSHIFSPFRGGGIPGVNLSEQGNAGWKVTTMRLVDAAKYDTATTIRFEEGKYKFDRNLAKSSGRGPSKAARDAKDRDDQMKVGEGFASIANDRRLIILEAEEIEKPSHFIPKGWNKHKPTRNIGKKKHTKNAEEEIEEEVEEEEVEEENDSQEVDDEEAAPAAPEPAPEPKKRGGKKRVITKADTPKKGTPVKKRKPMKTREEQLELAKDVLQMQELPTAPGHYPRNAPVVVLTNGTNIRQCRGCGKEIQKEQKQYPKNMVFRRRGQSGFFNKLTNKWVNKIDNIHFHLQTRCLRKNDQTVNWKDIMMTDEVFDELTRTQMEILKDEGILKYIVANLSK